MFYTQQKILIYIAIYKYIVNEIKGVKTTEADRLRRPCL